VTTIVDAHTHLLPGRLAQKVRTFLERHLPGPLVYPLDHEAVLEQLHAEGVQEVWSFPYAHRAGAARTMNEASAETMRRFAGGSVSVTAGATVHPGDDDPAGIVAEALDTFGLKLLKLHCSVGNFRLDDPRLTVVWELATSRRLPVIVHLGKAISGHTAADDIAELTWVLDRYPEMRIILAHSGHNAGSVVWSLLERYPNLYLDLTPVVNEPVPLPPSNPGRLAGRLLFGSDAPNTAIPVGRQLERLRRLALDPAAEAEILGGTARRLLAQMRSDG
jgi:predicted TIM-barrel fold metal-dependent hydrolase